MIILIIFTLSINILFGNNVIISASEKGEIEGGSIMKRLKSAKLLLGHNMGMYVMSFGDLVEIESMTKKKVLATQVELKKLNIDENVTQICAFDGDEYSRNILTFDANERNLVLHKYYLSTDTIQNSTKVYRNLEGLKKMRCSYTIPKIVAFLRNNEQENSRKELMMLNLDYEPMPDSENDDVRSHLTKAASFELNDDDDIQDFMPGINGIVVVFSAAAEPFLGTLNYDLSGRLSKFTNKHAFLEQKFKEKSKMSHMCVLESTNGILLFDSMHGTIYEKQAENYKTKLHNAKLIGYEEMHCLEDYLIFVSSKHNVIHAIDLRNNHLTEIHTYLSESEGNVGTFTRSAILRK